MSINFDPNDPFDRGLLSSMLGVQPSVKRKAYFAFHFADIMRVNNVRMAWTIDHPDSAINRSFYDSSLWEERKLTGDDGIKKLIREGVEYTSAVCVLIGNETWARRWVKYEIARSVIDGRGLLAVHINGINHHQRQRPDHLGYNPLHLLGVCKESDGQLKLYEKRAILVDSVNNTYDWQWHPYQDYTWVVSLPRYLSEPQTGFVTPLSYGTTEYNFATQDGHKKLGAWIDQAAQAVGR